MTAPIISVENLSKRYLIGHERDPSPTFRDVIGREARNFARKVGKTIQGEQIVHGDEIEELWALKDVNLEIVRGEVIGIIGRNGSGKSTLLKILSRIVDPTEGRVTLRGRVASLLEVGTGFHPELTGRENIYLNASILGLPRTEIKKKFDEIVAFAGTERFLDLPVKRYSSGMYVRLAFAVAAHIEPDILIVDEVLAVGDYEFQRKCLGKMQDVASRDGRTVLLVSHNLSAITDMADRAVLLAAGSVVAAGPVSQVIATYLSNSGANLSTYTRESDTPAPHVRKVEVITSEPNGLHQYSKALDVNVWVKHIEPMSKACLSIQIINQFQQPVIHAFVYYSQAQFGTVPGETVLCCRFPSLQLNIGQYYLRVNLSEPPGGGLYDMVDGICMFEVIRSDEQVLWGWRPEVCVYHEKWHWKIDGPILEQN